jgi:hypothetical protein
VKTAPSLSVKQKKLWFYLTLSGKSLRRWSRPDYETDENSPEFFSAYLRDKEGRRHCFSDCGKHKPTVLRQFVASPAKMHGWSICR